MNYPSGLIYGYRVLRACLHGGGGPQVGEVTRLAVVEKWPGFTYKLTTPGSRGDVTRHCCVVARHVNRDNSGRTTHFGGECSFPFIISSRCSISMLWLFTVTFDDTKLLTAPATQQYNASVARLLRIRRRINRRGRMWRSSGRTQLSMPCF